MLRIHCQSLPPTCSIHEAFSLAGPSPIASTPAPTLVSSRLRGSPVGTAVNDTLYADAPEILPKPMPIFCGTPAGRQSPNAVYRFPFGAQVGVHESQPRVLAICTICACGSQVIVVATACASSKGVSSTVPLQATRQTAAP